jgi:hypothetical protein
VVQGQQWRALVEVYIILIHHYIIIVRTYNSRKGASLATCTCTPILIDVRTTPPFHPYRAPLNAVIYVWHQYPSQWWIYAITSRLCELDSESSSSNSGGSDKKRPRGH